MKKLHFLLGLCFILALSSCSTVSKTANVARSSNTNVIINPIGASLDLADTQKISGEAEAWYFLGIRVAGDKKITEVPLSTASTVASIFKGRTKKVRSAALYNALENKNCDVVLSPRYDSKYDCILFGIIKHYKVKVNAYGCTIDKFYQQAPEDPNYGVMLNTEIH